MRLGKPQSMPFFHAKGVAEGQQVKFVGLVPPLFTDHCSLITDKRCHPLRD
jgi:hypothetical protein